MNRKIDELENIYACNVCPKEGLSIIISSTNGNEHRLDLIHLGFFF